MNTQYSIFPLQQAYNEMKDYITDDWLKVRVIHRADDILVHLEPSDTIPDDVDMEQYLCEQADSIHDDFGEWFPHLTHPP